MSIASIVDILDRLFAELTFGNCLPRWFALGHVGLLKVTDFDGGNGGIGARLARLFGEWCLLWEVEKRKGRANVRRLNGVYVT